MGCGKKELWNKAGTIGWGILSILRNNWGESESLAKGEGGRDLGLWWLSCRRGRQCWRRSHTLDNKNAGYGARQAWG